MSRQYVTTAIDYPNAAPHMGHVLEKVLADVVARWFRLRGNDVRFQIGTDEHGTKMQRTAEKEGIDPMQLADRNVPLFEDLYQKLNISHDYFIRTTDQQIHWPTVIELWKAIEKTGMLERRSYKGLYCSGCERFMTEKELEDGECPNHKKAPEEVIEENWFFLMSKDTNNLRNLLTQEWDGESYRIVPEFRQNETLALVDQGLEDVSFSRPKESLSWGVPVPGDEDQTMYVWCDALTNYISGLGYLTDKQDSTYWDDARVVHVIGKDIARFHALIWPSMLKHGGVRTPDQLLIHGFLTSEGEKMSKSTGNVVHPTEVLDRFDGNPDPVRFYLSHEVPVGRDGDFSWKRFEELYDGILRNNIGNLLNRVLVLLAKEDGELGDFGSMDINTVWKTYEEAMNQYDLKTGVDIALKLASEGNRLMEEKKPWSLEGNEKKEVLSHIAELLRHVALLLLPFMPQTAQNMSAQLGLSYAEDMLKKDFIISASMKEFGGQNDWKQVAEASILFAPLP